MRKKKGIYVNDNNLCANIQKKKMTEYIKHKSL